MGIKSGSGYPASKLSNFAPNQFVFDGVACASMEGFLQSLKFESNDVQVYVCSLVGIMAKIKGRYRNKAWKTRQTLWWQGVAYKRDSKEYQDLLDRAYQCLFDQNEKFRNALMSTKGANLTHSIGSKKQSETVLTEREFCSRLMKLRYNHEMPERTAFFDIDI